MEYESQQQPDAETAANLVALMLGLHPFPIGDDQGVPLASPDEPGASPAELAPLWSQDDAAAMAADLEMEYGAHGGAGAAAEALQEELLANHRCAHGCAATAVTARVPPC